jgi:hypothetical protein
VPKILEPEVYGVEYSTGLLEEAFSIALKRIVDIILFYFILSANVKNRGLLTK